MKKKRFWNIFFSIPAEALEKSVEFEQEIIKEIKNTKSVKKAKELWHSLGPGFTTGAADDDPSGIATYSQIGASKGTSLIWLSLFTFPLMGIVQEMCARIGLATGVGLATNIKRHYSKGLLYFATFLLVFANVFNIGADLGAMAKATELIFPFAPFNLLVIFFALLSLFLQIFISYKKYVTYLKYLTFVLFSYVLASFFVEMDWREVLNNTFIPKFSFTKENILLLCAVLGTTISPYLFFWQTSQEVEEHISKGERTEKERTSHVTHKEITNMKIDVWVGMFVSNLVMFFIIALCSATLFKNGIFYINSAEEAALALKPFAGNTAFFLFALGIIGTGLLAIPVLAGSVSYAVSESLNFKFGLYRKLKEAYPFYGVIILAVFLGILLNFIGLDPMKTLIYSAIFNGIASPLFLFFIVKLSGERKLMGGLVNRKFSNLLGWSIFGIMSLVAIISMYFIFML